MQHPVTLELVRIFGAFKSVLRGAAGEGACVEKERRVRLRQAVVVMNVSYMATERTAGGTSSERESSIRTSSSG